MMDPRFGENHRFVQMRKEGPSLPTAPILAFSKDYAPRGNGTSNVKTPCTPKPVDVVCKLGGFFRGFRSRCLWSGRFCLGSREKLRHVRVVRKSIKHFFQGILASGVQAFGQKLRELLFICSATPPIRGAISAQLGTVCLV